MWRRLPIAPLAIMLVCALAIPGCHTPSSLCQDWVDKMNAMFMRCGVPATYVVVRPTDGMQGCGTVSNVADPHALLDTCIPWTETVDCASIDPTNALATIPSECRAGTMFTYTR